MKIQSRVGELQSVQNFELSKPASFCGNADIAGPMPRLVGRPLSCRWRPHDRDEDWTIVVNRPKGVRHTTRDDKLVTGILQHKGRVRHTERPMPTDGCGNRVPGVVVTWFGAVGREDVKGRVLGGPQRDIGVEDALG